MTPLIDGREIQATVERLAGELSAAYGDGVLLVAVLKGSVPFLADLVRAMTVQPEIDFMALSAFGETGRVRIVKDLDVDIHDREVVVVEDIIDTGLTLTYLLNELRSRGPKSVEVCAMFDKEARRIVPTPVRFRGFRIENDFVIGYGLDLDGHFRNLRDVYAADPEAIRQDPVAHVVALYQG
ncbi:MAG: hypoxanthine phosphoribosyltransferase [Acidimicrobiales bacterium]